MAASLVRSGHSYKISKDIVASVDSLRNDDRHHRTKPQQTVNNGEFLIASVSNQHLRNTMSSSEEEFKGDESSEEEFQGDEESEEEDVLVADEEEESDDDEPLSAMKSKKRKAIPEDEEDQSSSDDDDVPLASLKSPAKKANKPSAKKKAPAKKKDKPAKATNKKEVKAATKGSFSTASSALYGTECQKGLLIQRLLCRWWYAYTWPDNIPDEPPKHYDTLDGMPGVFVCTSGSEVGKIKDTRDMSKCPNFRNFANKPASELKELLIKALKAQKEILVAKEGSGTDTEKELNSYIKWAEKLNPDKAEKEAAKVLKAAKISS
jgi:hypothetical protein